MFQLDEKQLEKLKQWQKARSLRPVGAIGGRYTYCFTPTELGLITVVIDETDQQEIDLTDYDMW